jgi:hypothetical protein
MGENLQEELQGGCLCGAVRFSASQKPNGIVACHCHECRQMTGHFMAAAFVIKSKLTILKSEGLRWYRSSPFARRGFCNRCGSTLFWDGDKLDKIGIAAGALDDTTGLKLNAHVYVPEKGCYYEITDGLPQYATDEDLPEP